ncbi:MAG: MOSC domain-containing protein [Proteobacteria bacterium]|nr:MOSC domain-containing protein [Pseudomonadota bacterium]
MRVLSVNVGQAESNTHGKRSLTTAIGKKSVTGPVMIRRSGVDGDTICDSEHHGGPDQAVYAYSGDDYVWWSQQLDRDIEHGTFGENLTIQGLPEDLNVGDRLLIGDVVLEVTAPRIPCDTLSAQMQDSRFGMAFRRAERPGVYLRVLHEGCVAAGDSVALLEIPQADASINELFRLAYDLQPKAADLRRYLDAPIAERVRKNIDGKLSALGG